MKREHPIDEWDRLQNKTLREEYDNGSNLRITKCSLTFTGMDDVKLIFRKSPRGVTIKFADYVKVGKKEVWAYLIETLNAKERVLIGEWLLDNPDKCVHRDLREYIDEATHETFYRCKNEKCGAKLRPSAFEECR